MKTKLLCKKRVKVGDLVLFEIDNFYYIFQNAELYTKPDLVIPTNELAYCIIGNCNSCLWFIKYKNVEPDSKWYIYDYFYSEREERLMKLKKIQSLEY